MRLGKSVFLGGAAILLVGAGSIKEQDAAPINPWMTPSIIAEQAAAKSDVEKEAIAQRRAQMLLNAMTLPQKMQQLTGSLPEILPELPQCLGARHVTGIASLNIPTFRITNGPVGVGQNDCVDASIAEKLAENPMAMMPAYTDPSSAKATALPSAMGVAASFDPNVAADFGDVIATEMNNLALHVFEAPGINLARVPVLGRNFEYFGEDPYLTGVMGVAETRAVQAKGLIAMPKHYVANEQETNRMTIQTTVDRQTLRELYLLPFEMAVKDGKAASIMCAYNYVNGVSSCESEELLTDVLRKDWGFTGYVQSDFFAMKSTGATLKSGMDHEMPRPLQWSPANLTKALENGEITETDIDVALLRRYTQTFKAGIFERPLVQTSIDFVAGGEKARAIGGRSAVLLQNNGALPFATDLDSVVIIGKASQVYAQQAVAGGSMTGKPMGAGGGSSDVVPHYTVSPVDGIRDALHNAGNTSANVRLILVDDANETATLDGAPIAFTDALAQAASADAVVVMAGTISEEGADRATFTATNGKFLADNAAAGSSLDWYTNKPSAIATNTEKDNPAFNSRTVAMIIAILKTPSTTGKAMTAKTALVLKDNGGVALDPILVGAHGPSILEVWFPGQEDGNIVADLIFGKVNPSGKLPVTFPIVGKGFLDVVTATQFPGAPGPDGRTQTVEYTEKLHIGYRWYDANVSGECAVVKGTNPCVAFPFGHGLSYTQFTVGKPRLRQSGRAYLASVTVKNIGKQRGAEVVQAYLALPDSASNHGAAQPPKRLVGFKRVELAPGESRTVDLIIDPSASNHPLSLWDEGRKQWVMPSGRYTVWMGRSSAPKDLTIAGQFSRK